MATGLELRIVDLLEPFRLFHIYHPNQLGSASLKAVLLALTGKGYENEAIQDGATAGREFLRIARWATPPKDRVRVRRNLLKYCALDTLGMVRIVDKLAKL